MIESQNQPLLFLPADRTDRGNKFLTDAVFTIAHVLSRMVLEIDGADGPNDPLHDRQVNEMTLSS